MWATRSAIRAGLSYPFEQLGVFMVWTMTPLGNERALKVNDGLGFKRKCIVPHAFGPKGHAQICQLTAPEYARKYGV
jgi:RimJ/RimL family protein N-acetyltransferase